MKKVMSRLWSNEFYQGGIVLTSGSFIINFLNYLFSVLTAKSLGPKGFGEISALLSYIAVTSLPFTILSSIIIQKISASGEHRKAYASSLEMFFMTKVKKLLVVFACLFIFIPFLPRLTNLSQLSSYSLLPLIILGFFGAFYTAANQGLRLFFLITVISIAASLLKFLGGVLVYLHIDGIATIICFLFFSAIISLITSYIFFHNKIGRLPKNQRRIERSIFSVLLSKQFLIFTLSVTAISLFGTIDIMFVKKFFSAETAGIYSSWSLFSKIILYGVGPLISLSFIFFSSYETRRQQKNILIVSLIVLLFIMFTSYLVYTHFARILIAVFFGDRFSPVIQYLGQASIFGSLYTAILFINNYFLSQKSFASLLLPFGLPFYIIFLFLVPKKIDQIIQLTISFSFSIICLYIVIFFMKYLKGFRHLNALSPNKK